MKILKIDKTLTVEEVQKDVPIPIGVRDEPLITITKIPREEALAELMAIYHMTKAEVLKMVARKTKTKH